MKNRRERLVKLMLFILLFILLYPGPAALADVQPTIVVSNPVNNSVVTVNSVEISGYVTGAQTLRIQGDGVPISGSGSFAYPVANLSAGNNTITITASNPTYSTTMYLTVVYDSTAQIPAITVQTPADNSEVSASPVTVSGRVYYNISYSYTLSIRVNGVQAYSGPCTADFSQGVNVRQGDNLITVTVQGAGVTAVKTLHVKYNDLPGKPNIFNLWPVSGTVVTTSSVTVSGTVYNTNNDGLRVNGTVVSFDSSGNFNKSVTLSPGSNNLTVTVTNGVYETARTIEVRYDANPIVTITSPANGAVVTQTSVTLAGKVFNAQSSGLTINKETASFSSSDGSFSRTVNLSKLTNDIEVKAYNSSLSTTTNLRVYYSGSPVINITSHRNGGTVENPDVILEGTVFPSDPNEISAFSINGVNSKSTISNGTFRSFPVTLAQGNNQLQLSLATNGVNVGESVYLPSRTASRNINLTYSAGPVITVTSPLEGSTVYSNLVTVYGRLKTADNNTLKVDSKETVVSSDGSFDQTVTLKSGKNEIKLEAKIGEITTTKTLVLYYDAIIKEGVVVKTKLDDGGEVKAFDDQVKVKLAKGSTGSNTTSVLVVTDPSTVADRPEQSAFVGPFVRLDWDGDKPLKPYKITLKYDQVVRENQAHKVTVFFYETSEDKWWILGGVVDAKSRTVSIETDKTGYLAATVYFRTFNDVSDHWAQRDIEFLVARGAVAGSSSDQFSPDNNVTRAEFTTFLVKALGLQPFEPEHRSYSDVDTDHWAYKYIEAALRAGFVSGVSHDYFAPNRSISREEAAALLARAGNLKTLKEQEVTKIFSSFSDANKISPWARNEVAAAIKSKLLNGSGLFAPQEKTTRAQAAAMIARLTEVYFKTKSTSK